VTRARSNLSRVYFEGQPVETLPRGRHKLSREEVEEDQRKRILIGTTEAVGEIGYGSLTVAEITKRARVSRGVFYRQFANRDEAFLAACSAASESMLANIYEVAGGFEDWVESVEVGTAALVNWLREYRAVARMMFLEMPAAGEAGLKHRDRLLDGYENLLATIGKWARAKEPGLPDMPSWVPRMAAGAIIESIGAEYRRDQLAQPDDLIKRLVALQMILVCRVPPDRVAT